MRNDASYVGFEAAVSYCIRRSAARTPELAQEAEPVDPETEGKENVVLRTGQAKYVVPLGYCEGKEGPPPIVAAVDRTGSAVITPKRLAEATRGTWRTPNRTAPAMIRTPHLLTGAIRKRLSCTCEYYPQGSGSDTYHRIIGAAEHFMTAGGNGSLRVRCIRDVIDR